ncbi:FecR domain-containing protein [Botrimarina hoheduenensis]|uniref:FecR protein n=1 Tax=Botrimarina hoheduenensis TaxID=2528000 RepID=A0A5C5W7K3_9BACT|nr:FecR domain-containing protein [Botrimarina hoheduenensis]TWT46886.1 FecR protein [Botrimarina hoheduenensis]
MNKPKDSADRTFQPAADRELVRLVNACCDDHATDGDIRRLEERLSNDPEALAWYVEQIGVHTSLDWSVTAQDAALAASVLNLETPFSQRSRPRGRERRYGREAIGYALLAVCASLVGIALTGWALQQRSAPSEAQLAARVPTAKITHPTDGARWVVLCSNSRPDGMRTDVFPNETVHLTSGQMRIDFEQGAEVTLTGPAVLQVLAPDRAVAVRGKLTAVVSEEAIGFAIDTPRAHVVDLGTRFGVEVDDLGQTDVVVFEGEVDIAYGPIEQRSNDWSRRVMRMGEAVRVDDLGAAQRIVSIPSERFAAAAPSDAPLVEPVIADIRDNIRGDQSWNYYEVVRAGLREDALAYVDRESHEWNGFDERGLPAYLLGADYVKMFNNDKVQSDYELSVTVARPALLFVLFDDRVPPPEWLVRDFTDTGDDVGMDRGRFRNLGGTMNESFASGVGPGVSIEDRLSVWVRRVEKPSSVLLGATQTPHNRLNMYGIAAVPLLD